ncbi:hypothetical protein [Rhizobium sp. IBUN]|uniref:hypothetical protein n=1 Tax=Rhizobium sp. IBUN TaxID=1042326 RepID=UPI000405E66F|nr:hypothetical protein [Rhizobium sp. IBUN]
MGDNLLRLNLPAKVVSAATEAHLVAIQPYVDAFVGAERTRVCDLITLAEQARKIGVEMDLLEAITEGASVDDVRAYVLEMAASERGQE